MLDEQTRKRMQELFANQKCERCGEAARRLRNNKFYCQACFPIAKELEAEQQRNEANRKAS